MRNCLNQHAASANGVGDPPPSLGLLRRQPALFLSPLSRTSVQDRGVAQGSIARRPALARSMYSPSASVLWGESESLLRLH